MSKEKRIECIQIGHHEDAPYYFVGLSGATKIEKGFKVVSTSPKNEILVYNVFSGEKLVAELSYNLPLIISFFKE